MLTDSFYTPKILADKLVGYVKKESIKNVADFCVGDGELLRSAELRWPNIKCFGSDISEQAISSTSINHPDWKLSRLDFLNFEERKKAKIFKSQSKYELILLNPPFSCRGGTLHSLEIDGQTFTVSTSMRFLVTALTYLQEGGILYAIMPTSTAYSQKDQKVWTLLEKKYNLSILEEPNIKYFKGCAPNVILVSLNDFSKVSRYKNITRLPLSFKNLEVYRGKLSMNLIGLNIGKHYLIHSTNIKNNTLVDLDIKQDEPLSEVSGPAILLPRVGKPNQLKVCVIKGGNTYVISDCIIAIKTASNKDADLLYRYMFDNWQLIENMYKGTGAKYVTVEKIKQFLNLDISSDSNRVATAV